MTRSMALLAVSAVALLSCKGETKYRDNPDTMTQLEKCQNLSNEKQKYIANLEGKLAAIEQQGGPNGEVVISVSGDGTLTVTGGRGPTRATKPRDPAGDAKDLELYKAFLAKVNGTKGTIKKCYQNALKKDSSLTAATIVLNITVKYKASGSVANTDFDKSVSSNFSSCMRTIAKKWNLPASVRSYTFKAPVTLTPQ
jgi:hypothetical protein